MTRRAWLALAIVAVPLAGYVLVSVSDGAPRFPTRDECVRVPVEGQAVDVVFGRFDDIPSADELQHQVVSVGFAGVEVEADGCGRWKVVLANVPSIETAREVQKEAESVDLAPKLERASET